MNADVKALWVAALRSGEYKQATGRLRRPLENSEMGFCCWGVLCELAVARQITTVSEKFKEYNYEEYGLTGDHLLPPLVLQWAGIDPALEETESLEWTLAKKNDSKMPFSEIADYIEANL